MASTYVNNLRLEEIGTGEQSGTWGDTTNTNLKIIGQAVAWGQRAIANASTDNITIGDGALDADRCLGLKLTGGGQACAVTLLPLTSSKTWFIYNTTNSTLTFRAGSNTTSEQVAILAGETKVIATDGLGANSIVYDLLTAVNLAGTTTVDDLTVSDTALVTGVLTTTAATVFNGGFASNAASSIGGTTPTLTIGDAGAEDAKIVFDGNAADYHVGLDDSEDALQIGLGAALGTTPRITIRAAEVVVNDLGIDLDFRVEGDADTHALFVEGETDRVSIGSNDPPMKLTVRNGSANSDIAKFTGDGTGAGLTISTAATTRADDTVIFKASDAFGELSFLSDNTEVLRLTKDNNVVIPNSGGTLFTNTAGTSNLRLGVNTGNSIVSGANENVLIGDEAGTTLVSGGINNTAVGFSALKFEDAHGYNTAIGWSTLKNLDAGANGYNTAVGADSGRNMETGINNTLVGAESGHDISTGGNNTFLGAFAGDKTDDGASNVAVGHSALGANCGNQNTAVGASSLASCTGTENTAVGTTAGFSLSSGTANTFMGQDAGLFATTTDGCTFIGHSAAQGITGTKLTGNQNTAVGFQAAFKIEGTAVANTFVGGLSGGNGAISGGHNTAVGGETLYNLAGGIDNVIMGYQAGGGITTGSQNVAIGREALETEDTGSASTAVGYLALRIQNNDALNHNAAFGYQAGVAVTGGTGNTLIGSFAGHSVSTGINNIVLGFDSSVANGNNNNCIVIGKSIAGASNDFSFGKASNVVTNDFDTDANWSRSSDERLKKNITNQTLGLDFINDLRTVKYNWKASNELDSTDSQLTHLYKKDAADNEMNTDAVMHNFIAQEVKAALDTAGVSSFGGWKKDQYGVQQVSREMFVIPLVKAVQELSTALDAALARIATLEG